MQAVIDKFAADKFSYDDRRTMRQALEFKKAVTNIQPKPVALGDQINKLGANGGHAQPGIQILNKNSYVT